MNLRNAFFLDEDDEDGQEEGQEQEKELGRFDALLLSKMVEERIVFMSDEVNSQSAKKVINQLQLLEAMDKEKPIFLFINSPGGEIYSGMAVYDMINFITPPIITIASGMVASMGTTILVARNGGKRFALPNARVMIHQPWGGIRGAAADIDIQAQEILRLKELTVEILARKTGQSEEKVSADINRNYWMSAEEAKEYGLVDHVIRNHKDLLAHLDSSPANS